MKLLPARAGLHNILVRLGLPLPRSEVEEMRLLDRWEAEVAARISLVAVLMAATAYGSAMFATFSFPPIPSSIVKIVFVVIGGLSLAAFVSALSAVRLGWRSMLPSPSPSFGVGIALGLAVAPLGVLVGVAGLLFAGVDS